MRLQDVLAVGAAAVVTTAFTLALVAPRDVGAVDATGKITPVIARPQLTSEGCRFVLKADKATYEAGQAPGFELTASNPTGKPATATVWVQVLASAPASPMSRVMPRPRSLWSHQCVVSLAPGETKTLSIASDAKLPAGQRISITLSDKAASILAGGLNVPARPTAAAQGASAPRAGGSQR